ncbi:MAG: hypothetical protein A9Z00_15130 [Thermobacillus sp. ZCTH02-B1]|uniref:TraX family protein n=1 Tax=Thermobacillus sp. ZCTH02-B1 TaxID=1858795 RepID=UPI000B560DA8|nr:TraX family protein [Thermobacillus sp. ZCTH02-B1]OUM94432.1 MAG: hypothetical protein A9Z00_15130 [Thermobacillus sp. ZCTH02-B1]
MQLLAMLTMLIDHIGIVLDPDNPHFRLVGRLAMPLYAYALVVGFGRMRDFRRYALRLAAIAAISQWPYQYALLGPDEPFELNVVFTLLASLIVLRLIDVVLASAGRSPAAAGKAAAEASVSAGRPSPAVPPSAALSSAESVPAAGADAVRRLIAALGIAAAGCLLLELVPCDYGSHLLLLVLIYRFSSGQTALALHFFLNLIGIAYGFPPEQMFSLLATLLVRCAPGMLDALNRRLPVPRLLWRSFYPAHLAALAAVRFFASA